MNRTRHRDRPPVEARVCRAIRLLAEGLSTEEVARAVGVRPPTVEAWRAGEEFQSLLDCLIRSREVPVTPTEINDLTPGALLALRRALDGDDMALAMRAAHEVLERVGSLVKKSNERTIRVEYLNRDGKPVSSSPWAERNPVSPGPLQGGGLRAPLREDGDGENPDS